MRIVSRRPRRPRSIRVYVQKPEIRNFEYASIIARAQREGWLRELVAAHLTPCDEEEARRILAGARLYWKPEFPRETKVAFSSRRGRARFNTQTKRYGLSLPSVSLGERSKHNEPGRLRSGLVLHELAHILDHISRAEKRFDHGPLYCEQLRRLVTESAWRKWQMAPSEKLGAIFARHSGPYRLMITRQMGAKQATTTFEQRYSAIEAHEEARKLVKQSGILDVYVFSESEGQFIGASYKQGEEYAPWAEAQPPQEQLAAEAPAPTLTVTPGAQAEIEQIAARLAKPAEPESLMAAAAKAMKPKRTPPAPKKRVLLELDLGNAEGWPRSEAAQLVRSTLEALGKATAADLAEQLKAQMTSLGVAHPASLISRLKQAGFLREADAE